MLEISDSNPMLFFSVKVFIIFKYYLLIGDQLVNTLIIIFFIDINLMWCQQRKIQLGSKKQSVLVSSGMQLKKIPKKDTGHL